VEIELESLNGIRASGTVAPRKVRLVSEGADTWLPMHTIREIAVGEHAEELGPPPTWKEQLARVRIDGLDVVLVVDATTSMGDAVKKLAGGVDRLVTVLNELVPGVRVGVVAYRDSEQYDPNNYTFTTRVLDLQAPDAEGVVALKNFLEELDVPGGADVPDAVFDGLHDAVHRIAWRETSRKVIVLIGDAPPHAEKRGLLRTFAVATDWHAQRKSTVACLLLGKDPGAVEAFKEIADCGGGIYVVIDDDARLFPEVLIAAFGEKWRKHVEEVWQEDRGR
jgi:Mg-chelatase subunit ChlD